MDCLGYGQSNPMREGVSLRFKEMEPRGLMYGRLEMRMERWCVGKAQGLLLLNPEILNRRPQLVCGKFGHHPIPN